MRTINLNLMMQKGIRVVQMITAHKSFLIFTYLKDESKIKVALAVELSIYKRIFRSAETREIAMPVL